MREGRWLRRTIVVLPLLLLAVVAWWAWRSKPGPTPGSVRPAAEPPAAQAPETWRRRRAVDARTCASHAATTCKDGDAWWIDACGELEGPAQDCGAQRCVSGECRAPAAAECGDVSAFGRCERDVARTCLVDRLIEVDCRARGARCVMGSEGPMCRAPSSDDCTPGSPPRCQGQTLRSCVDGRWQAFACEATGGVCLPAAGARPARCVFALPVVDPACDACGCDDESGEEICDGVDNDGDGAVDEEVECEPVPILAVVVAARDGQPSAGEDEVIAAIAELNAAFARDDGGGLAFELAQSIEVVAPELLELDQAERNTIIDVDEWLARRGQATESTGFHVPVLFTAGLEVDGVARPGLSTVPNGSCGGERRVWERQPPVGYVALAQTRWSSTLAHEMGHFLGLCHTHEAPAPVERVAAGDDLDAAPRCDEHCPDDTDGICDTAYDPGPAMCSVDGECAVHCSTGDRPDVGNMMAYYPDCRTGFSDEQMRWMRRTLAQRRAWEPCLRTPGCTCDPAAQGCPAGMTCVPFDGGDGAATTAWRCDLDGAANPGGRCGGAIACGHGSICVGTPDDDRRCTRICTPGVTACRCEGATDLGVHVCADDLGLE